MSNLKKALVNTSALYGKIIINAAVAVLTTRIVLKCLGEIDFGLFSLIGGVIMLLSFLNGSLLQSTQRFLSLAIGEGNPEKSKLVFNSSISLHLLFSVFLLILFVAFQPLLFNGFLKIPADRTDIAIDTYQIVALTTAFTFLTVPYNAAINAREEMWFFAIVDVLMSVMKLGAAIVLTLLPEGNGNLLVVYTGLILVSVVVALVLKIVWCMRRYPETSIHKRLLWDKSQLKAQLGFTGWNTFASFAMVCRNQGVAVVMNLFFGPAINAAYGVANQLNSLATTFSATLSTVFAPQIIQSHGAGDRERMLRLAIFSSKISFYLSAVVGLPIVLESETILRLWLTEIPDYSVIFCNLTILVFIIMQIYPGLVRCLYAQGDIKWYQIMISIALMLPIFLGYLGYLLFEYQPQFIVYMMLFGQIITMFITVYFAKIKVGLNVNKFLIYSVFIPSLLFFIVYVFCFIEKRFVTDDVFRFVLVVISSLVLFSMLFYFFVFTLSERNQLNSLFNKLFNKVVK